jgi:hypothetical protein
MNLLSLSIWKKVAFSPYTLLLLVSLLDSMVSSDAHLFLLYLAPMIWLATQGTLRSSMAIVVVGLILWWLAKIANTGSVLGDGYRWWNGFSRLLLFGGVVSLVHYLSLQLREKEKLVALLRDARQSANPVSGIRRYCRRTDRVQGNSGHWMETRTWLSREAGVVWVDADSGEGELPPRPGPVPGNQAEVET